MSTQEQRRRTYYANWNAIREIKAQLAILKKHDQEQYDQEQDELQAERNEVLDAANRAVTEAQEQIEDSQRTERILRGRVTQLESQRDELAEALVAIHRIAGTSSVESILRCIGSLS